MQLCNAKFRSYFPRRNLRFIFRAGVEVSEVFVPFLEALGELAASLLRLANSLQILFDVFPVGTMLKS
jgi:hypothetical protein